MRRTQQGRLARLIKLGVCAVVAGLLIAGSVAPVQSATAVAMRFGADLESLDTARKKGLPISYGTVWAGAWNAKTGWGHIESELRSARRRGVTPVINWWYWGDDISVACVERGCRDERQRVNKDRASWTRLSTQLAHTIARSMDGREAIVVLETEFNKGGIETHEPFDGYLAEQIAIFKRSGTVKVVLGFGNWGQNHWPRFDRAIAASDYLGTQLLRSSVREASSYLKAVDTLVGGARHLHTRFHKPVMVVDLALSSYPAAAYETRQAEVTRQLFARLPELKRAGVRGILYRMIADDPKFDTSNYHGVAERHWGFLRADGSEKPAFRIFAAGLRREAAEPAGAAVAGE